MKKRLSLVCLSALAALFGSDTPQAVAQLGPLGRRGVQANQPDTFRRVAGDINVGLPGRLWFETNFADEGLGYNGSYATIGGKRRLFEDILDGRWLGEVRLHHSFEDNGGFFANVGLERVFSIDAAKADVVTGFWYDFDGDQQGNFGNDFSQVGVNAAIRTQRWDLIGNGYFPVGITDRVSAPGLFFGNNIQLQQGIDSALTGFDVTLRLRPKQLAFVNGSIELGGYGYSSDLVNSFGGGRVRLGMQSKRGFTVGLEVNHDDRFQTTGGISVGYTFGAQGGIGGEYSQLGRDLEQTVRNDHIVRFNQDVVLAIDPDTGAAFNVVHVNNLADGAFEDGSVDRPFDSLLDAQVNSDVGDIIYVNAGDGTDRFYDQGIILQDDQILLGSGGQFLLPTANQGIVELIAAGGTGPTISNAGQFDVVRLADRNIVTGVNIDATGATNGISGNGVSEGTIQGTNISGATEDGILAVNVQGDWTITNTNSSGNGRDGIHFNNFTSNQITLNSNVTNGNSRHGVFLENDLLQGGQIDILNHTSSGNTGVGVLVENGDGNLNILNSSIVNNTTGGIRTTNFTNSDPTQRTLVSTIDGGTSDVSGNIVDSNIEFQLNGPGQTQNVLVTQSTVNNGGRGIVGRTIGEDTTLNLDIIDTISINNNTNEGILAVAQNGSTINTNIASTVAFPLQIIDNGIISGAAISLTASGANDSEDVAQINANIDNVRVQVAANSPGGNGIQINSTGNAVAKAEISNADIERSLIGNAAIPNNFNVNGDGLIAAGDFGIALIFDNNGGGDINHVNIRDTTIETDNGILIATNDDTFTDVSIVDSVIQAAGPRAAGRGPGLNNPTTNPFGDVGIAINANGNLLDPDDDNLTRVTIERTLIQDFSGPASFGFGGPGFNGLGEALNGSAVDVLAQGDANLIFNLTSNQILNNGAGFSADIDNDGLFGELGDSNAVENPLSVLFFDAVRVNALDSSVVSTRIVGNFFQDNFERAISIDTYDSATINAQVLGNAFDNNDRGNDPGRGTFRTLPTGLNNAFNSVGIVESQNFDFEAVNNEEFFIRAFENPLAVNPMDGNVLDADGNMTADLAFNDPTADNTFTNLLAPGFATLNLDLDGNGFEFGTVLLDFATPPGDFSLSGSNAAAGLATIIPGVGAVGSNPITPAAGGFTDQLISNEELLFQNSGFKP